MNTVTIQSVGVLADRQQLQSAPRHRPSAQIVLALLLVQLHLLQGEYLFEGHLGQIAVRIVVDILPHSCCKLQNPLTTSPASTTFSPRTR